MWQQNKLFYFLFFSKTVEAFVLTWNRGPSQPDTLNLLPNNSVCGHLKFYEIFREQRLDQLTGTKKSLQGLQHRDRVLVQFQASIYARNSFHLLFTLFNLNLFQTEGPLKLIRTID